MNNCNFLFLLLDFIFANCRNLSSLVDQPEKLIVTSKIIVIENKGCFLFLQSCAYPYFRLVIQNTLISYHNFHNTKMNKVAVIHNTEQSELN
jgi:hypothetical protein